MDLHGLLMVDKPADFTSHDVVAKMRRTLRQKRIGHTGTLDPIATGLMVMVLGEATKLSDYLMSEDKAYAVQVRLGVTTDTLDRAGKVLELRAVNVNEVQIREAADSLQGEFQWAVPAYSAMKVDGKPLYEKARQGIPFEKPLKTMSFWDVKVGSVAFDLVTVTMNCSKGSFVRTWVEKLGEKLGTGAIVEELRRTRVGAWSLEQGISLPQLEEAASHSGMNSSDLGGAFVSLTGALPGIRSVIIDEKETRLMANGQIPRSLASRLIPEQKQAFDSGQPVYIKVVSTTGELLSLLGAEPGQGLKIRRVFRLA